MWPKEERGGCWQEYIGGGNGKAKEVLNYWLDWMEGYFLTPQRVQKVTQACPGIIASYHSFGETARKACLEAARLAGCCVEGDSGKCFSKLPQWADCCLSQKISGTEQAAQWLRTCPVPTEDLSSVDSTHITVDNHSQPYFWGIWYLFWALQTLDTFPDHVHTCRQNIRAYTVLKISLKKRRHFMCFLSPLRELTTANFLLTPPAILIQTQL